MTTDSTKDHKYYHYLHRYQIRFVMWQDQNKLNRKLFIMMFDCDFLRTPMKVATNTHKQNYGRYRLSAQQTTQLLFKVTMIMSLLLQNH